MISLGGTSDRDPQIASTHLLPLHQLLDAWPRAARCAAAVDLVRHQSLRGRASPGRGEPAQRLRGLPGCLRHLAGAGGAMAVERAALQACSAPSGAVVCALALRLAPGPCHCPCDLLLRHLHLQGQTCQVLAVPMPSRGRGCAEATEGRRDEVSSKEQRAVRTTPTQAPCQAHDHCGDCAEAARQSHPTRTHPLKSEMKDVRSGA